MSDRPLARREEETLAKERRPLPSVSAQFLGPAPVVAQHAIIFPEVAAWDLAGEVTLLSMGARDIIIILKRQNLPQDTIREIYCFGIDSCLGVASRHFSKLSTKGALQLSAEWSKKKPSGQQRKLHNNGKAVADESSAPGAGGSLTAASPIGLSLQCPIAGWHPSHEKVLVKGWPPAPVTLACFLANRHDSSAPVVPNEQTPPAFDATGVGAVIAASGLIGTEGAHINMSPASVPNTVSGAPGPSANTQTGGILPSVATTATISTGLATSASLANSSFLRGDVKPLHTPQSTDSIYYKLLWWPPPLPWLNLAALASGRRLLPRFPGDVPPTAADLLSWAPAIIYVSAADGDDGDDDNTDSEISTSDDLASHGGPDTTTVPASTVNTTTAGSSTTGPSTAPSTAAVTPAPTPTLLGAAAPGMATNEKCFVLITDDKSRYRTLDVLMGPLVAGPAVVKQLKYIERTTNKSPAEIRADGGAEFKEVTF
ncbi:hypothetical protein FDECE_16631 [Fusarium decemcellulare]|nr:hypothetical protein FDECE_16631 [Fusarium decemcellulare]